MQPIMLYYRRINLASLLYISILLQMVKYYARLLKQNSGSLLYEAYKESLLLSNDNKDSWMNFMKHLLETYVNEHILNTFYSDPSNSVILVKHIKYKMYYSFEKLWLESICLLINQTQKDSLN